ncbi:MAG: PilZ domain-containing protein [Acidobacteria bacterium]|nr:PilZ domain-containing protein [Acidobacteriota bacterium]
MMATEDRILLDYEAIKTDEQRSEERIYFYLNARWEGELGRYVGTISDISTGGCFVLTGGSVTKNDFLKLDIQLPTDEWITTWGEVANNFPEIGFGVRYRLIDDESHAKYIKSIEYVRNIKGVGGVLRRLNAMAVRKEHGKPVEILTTAEQYKALVMLALPKVNKALLGVPECQRKNYIRLSMRCYVDASLAWEAMLGGRAGGEKELVRTYKRLQVKYGASAKVLTALLGRNAPPVLDFLWRQGCIYFTLAS